jgi:hypothetical protein
LGVGATLPLAACGPPPGLAPPAGVGLLPLKTFSVLESAALLDLAGVRGVSPRHAVDCYRINYGSHDSAGRPIRLSGLLALPRGVAARGLVSWQHGTTTTRADVPSSLSVDGKAAAIVFAGAGYAVTAPDYIGLGESRLVHPYLVADDAARAVSDLIRAARDVPGVPASPPFLIGFSQGGHASLASQQVLESLGERVMGVVAVAGPHNLRTISLGAGLAGGAPSDALYLTYMTRGYGARYGEPMESVLTANFATLTRRLYDTPHPPEAIMAALPKAPRTMFRPDFLAAFDEGRDHWLLSALAANETSHFKPAAPVRLYYGHRDVDVLPAEALTTSRMMTALGADVAAIDLGPYGHNESILHAAPRALAWFQSLRG